MEIKEKLKPEMEEIPSAKIKPRFHNTKFLPDNKVPLNNDCLAKYKSVLEERRRHQIYMLCTDLSEISLSKHVIDSAIALKSYGHKVSIITSAFSKSTYSEDLAQINVIKVGTWIPQTISGFFYDFFYFLRSVYTTLSLIYRYKQSVPTSPLLFCETSAAMIPLIRYMTDFKILLYQYNFNYAKFRLPTDKLNVYNWFSKQAFQNADEIIVPNNTFARLFKRCFDNVRISPFICEPYLNIRKLRKQKLVPIGHIFENIAQDSFIFLVLGEFHPRSNFELAIDAFYLVIHSVQHQTHRKMHLVVSGHCSRRDFTQRNYYRRMQHRVRTLNLMGHVTFSKRMAKCHKKTLMMHAVALLDTSIDCLFNRYVLEAMALGRPVIAPDSGFTKEVLDNGVSGYVVPPTPEHFSVAMAEILFNAGKAEFIGKMANCEFIKIFSLEAFAARLHTLVGKYCGQEKEHVTFHPEVEKNPGGAADISDSEEMFVGI